MPEIFIGTSGWSYPHWEEIFYPKKLASVEWLSYYSCFFSTVEINNSFYHLPRKETFKNWKRRVPKDFIFTVKASRFITHIKKLNDVGEAFNRLWENCQGLSEKLGPLLFQFPPNWKKNQERLRKFLEMLPDHYYAFEFRNESWFSPDIFRLLRNEGAALCITSSPSFPSTREITAPYTFIRMHGGKELYGSNYSEGELKEWSKFISDLNKKKIDVYVYFNNDAHGYAVQNAMKLKEFLNLKNNLF